MAGTKTGNIVELISPFLRGKLAELAAQFGEDSPEWRAIALQYIKSPLEGATAPSDRRRHYESEVTLSFEGKPLLGWSGCIAAPSCWSRPPCALRIAAGVCAGGIR